MISFSKHLQNYRGDFSRSEFCSKISPLLSVRTYEAWEQGTKSPSELFQWLLLRRIEHVFKIKIKESK